ncbi:hypothetical protein [Cellulosilyticum sp. I15G10I2]|uniref:hypothetical protein n=1 Tax=Cellulosilyticum sp. I15G10I2 TaxID=1892843 RepID=UPI00085CBBFB|nr:hypothetical protein [Cellulosilyticum sp. I15G10I2]
MLKRNQYLMTLVVAIMIFFIIFTIGYYYIQSSASHTEPSYEGLATRSEKSVDVLGAAKPETVVSIQPDTQIHLLIVDEHNNELENKKLDPLVLLGLNESDIKNKFSGYDVVEFNVEQVALKKVLPSVEKVFEYTLGIQNNRVCIVQKEEGKVNKYIDLDMSASHFSRKTYSLLLKEQIAISPLQKDALLSNPNYIEKILQSYEEE